MTAESKNPLGLLFTGGEGPESRRILSIMEEARNIAGSGLLILAADSGLLLAESAGVKVDWIIGDMDSLTENAPDRLTAYPPEKILRYPEDKDFTDTELAFSFLLEKGYTKIWIIGGGGGRIDQLFGIRSLFERDCPPERWVTAVEDIRCIAENPPVPFELTVSFNTPLSPVSVFPLGCGPWEAASTGLKWSLAGLPWTRDFIAISNVALKGSFTITAKQGRFLVMWPLVSALGCSLS